MRTELKRLQSLLSTDQPKCLEKQSEDDEVVDDEVDVLMRSSRKAFLKITVDFLKELKQDQLADCLQSSKPYTLRFTSSIV